jgi:hypothetical protein
MEIAMSDIMFTDHARTRIAQRGIQLDAVRTAVDFGRRQFRQGYQFYFLGQKYLPANLTPAQRDRLSNLLVVCRGNLVITAYRNPMGFRHVARKSKYLLSDFC